MLPEGVQIDMTSKACKPIHEGKRRQPFLSQRIARIARLVMKWVYILLARCLRDFKQIWAFNPRCWPIALTSSSYPWLHPLAPTPRKRPYHRPANWMYFVKLSLLFLAPSSDQNFAFPQPNWWQEPGVTSTDFNNHQHRPRFSPLTQSSTFRELLYFG